MRLALFLRLPVLVLAVAAGCSSSSPTGISYEPETPGIQRGYVSITPSADGLVVVNETARPVYLMAIEQGTAALADWVACTGGPGCPGLSRGQSRTLTWSSVLGYAPDRRNYVVSWWHVETSPEGSMRAGAIQSLVVTR